MRHLLLGALLVGVSVIAADAQELGKDPYAAGLRFHGFLLGPKLEFGLGSTYLGPTVGYVFEQQKSRSLVHRFDAQYGFVAYDYPFFPAFGADKAEAFDQALSAAATAVVFTPVGANAKSRPGLGIGLLGTFARGTTEVESFKIRAVSNSAILALAPSLHYQFQTAKGRRLELMARYELAGLYATSIKEDGRRRPSEGVRVFPRDGVTGGLQLVFQYMGLLSSKEA